MPSFKSLINSLVLILSSFPEIGRSSNCKVTPSSPDWPLDADWKALNQSVSGRLVAPVPAGAVCHSDRLEFNNQSCTLLAEQWTNSSFHSSQPASVDYNDDTCPPIPLAPCSADGYPAYVIAAANEKDIQEGVKFAHRTGVRLIVKGTGHDIPSRSSGRGSLSIWTHNIRGIEILEKKDGNAVGTATIAAGMRGGEILEAAAEHNVTIVTGADPGVGIGGWNTGAGHGPLTARYGLGADQILAMEVVTANGNFLRIDPDHHPDLFWAMRGGGGSTFAIIVSITVRVYPQIAFSQYLFSFNTTSNTDTYWNLTTLFHSFIPSLSEAGVMGYYYVFPSFPGETDPSKQGKLSGALLVPEKNANEVQQIMAPIEAAVNNSDWADPTYPSTIITEYLSFAAQWAQNQGEAVGVGNRVGSRLLDHKALTSNLTALNIALRTAAPAPWTLIGHIVAGPGPRNVAIPGGSNAVNPAWRKAYSHVVLPTMWTPGNSTQEKEVFDDLRNVRTQALRDLAPDAGAYMNEGDPTEPEWQETFWGKHYEKLLAVKREWDPRGVFWCRPCVGNEDWVVEGSDAIGQHEGTICRK